MLLKTPLVPERRLGSPLRTTGHPSVLPGCRHRSATRSMHAGPFAGRGPGVAVAAQGSPATSTIMQTGSPLLAPPSISALTGGAKPRPCTSGAEPSTLAPSKPGPASSRHAAMPPDAIPLQLKHGAVVSESRGVVLDMLPPATSSSGDAQCAEHGALVLGLANQDGPTSLVDLRLGQLNVSRMLACARCKLWWMTPEWRSSTLALPPETQFLLAELRTSQQHQQGSGREDQIPGAYALLLPLIDSDFRATLRAGRRGEGELTLRVESGDERVKRESWSSILYIATGTDPFLLVERGVAAAARLSGGALPRTEKVLPPSVDVFGWCTWDAFYSTVSARGIAEGLRSLNQGGIRPRTLIIDDGWQTTDVDPEFRKAPTSELAEQLKLRQQEQQLLESMDQVFYEESMEVLAEVAGQLPAGTPSGTLNPGLSNLGAGGASRSHFHPPVSSMASGSTMGSINTTATSTSVSISSMDSAARAPMPLPDASAHAPAPTTASAPTATSRPPSAAAPPAPAASARQAPPALAATPAVVRDAEVAPATASPQQPNSSAVLAVRIAQRVAGWLTGLGTAAFLMVYQWVIEPAAPGSWPVQAFSHLAAGPLRPLLLAFYANASDFTRRLTSVRANGKFSHPFAGPEDEWLAREERLGEVVASLKQQFGLDFVYCWHGLPAYWAGVSPDAPELQHHGAEIMFSRPTPGVLEVEPSMAWNPAVLAGVGVIQEPGHLYDSMHSYLRVSGVDGVKVDCQAGVGLVGSEMGGGAALSRRFHAALEESVAKNFSSNHCINCMCHSTENLYRMQHTSVARASDDFYPRDAASSHPHLAACAFNGLFLSALVQPDWDMFHSKHPSARLHGMARAISGGAVYVSDKPGEHDFELLRRLVLPDGSVLRALQPARPTRDCLFSDVLRDGKSLLKVWNVNAVCGVVGLFHLQGSSWDRVRRKFYVHDSAPKALTAQVYPSDVEAWTQQQQQQPGQPQQYVMHVFSDHSLHVVDPAQGVAVTLQAAVGDVVTVAPILEAAGGARFAPLGLCDMFNGGGAVRSCTVADAATSPSSSSARFGHAAPRAHSHHTATGGNGAAAAKGPAFIVSVRGCGRFLAWSCQAPTCVSVDGMALYHTYDAATGALHLDVPPTQDLTCLLAVHF